VSTTGSTDDRQDIYRACEWTECPLQAVQTTDKISTECLSGQSVHTEWRSVVSSWHLIAMSLTSCLGTQFPRTQPVHSATSQWSRDDVIDSQHRNVVMLWQRTRCVCLTCRYQTLCLQYCLLYLHYEHRRSTKISSSTCSKHFSLIR